MSEPTPEEFTDQVLSHIHELIEGDDQESRAAAERIVRAAVSDATGHMLACGLAYVAQSFIRALHDLGVPTPISEHTPWNREEAEHMMISAKWLQSAINETNTFSDFMALVDRGPRFMAEFYVFLMMTVRQLGREVIYQEKVSQA